MLHTEPLHLFISLFCPILPMLGRIFPSHHFLQCQLCYFLFLKCKGLFLPDAALNLILIFPNLIHLCFISIWFPARTFVICLLSYHFTFHLLLQKIQVILNYIESTDRYILTFILFLIANFFSKLLFVLSLNDMTIFFFFFLIVESFHRKKIEGFFSFSV